ncbi:MAG: DUF3489 domain-containing protein [Bryobacteraceae bacterium]|jgi:hypothetical protein
MTFTIDNENNITAHGTPEEAAAATAAPFDTFASHKDLAALVAVWPTERLVEIWNAFAGVAPFGDLKPVKKFTDRKTAVTRIWQAIQKLAPPVPEAALNAPATATATTEASFAYDAPKAKKGAKKTKPKLDKAAKAAKAAKKATGAREGSKKTLVLDLLSRKRGATLAEIAKATDWQRHSIRGFISGTITKKMGFTVESSKNEANQRTYRIPN